MSCGSANGDKRQVDKSGGEEVEYLSTAPALTDSEVSQWQEQPIGNCRHGNLYASVQEWIDKP